MKLEGLRIRNFRTISSEQDVDLRYGLTLVGPNNSGKTNVLKAIEMLFTGDENILGYSIRHDLTFGLSSGQTSLVATFTGDPVSSDKDFFDIYNELNSMLEEPKQIGDRFILYLTFTKSGNPQYRFFSNEKMKKELQAQFSRKQINAVNFLLGKFVCHYVPSSKSIDDLYSSLLVPFLKRSVANILSDKIQDINNNLKEISDNLDRQLAIAGLPNISAEFKLPNNSIEQFLNNFEFHLSDPNKTEIDRKGMGIQASAILASFVWITNEEAKLNKNTIWLIEEPESYLHPDLASSCHRMLEQLRSISLLVTTTHSLGFVNQDPRKVVGTMINENQTRVIKYDSYLDATASIRKALGVRFSDYYNLDILNIFVEGKSDREVFQWFLDAANQQKDEKFDWSYVRKSSFLDFTGVSGLEGFMKATYEFICKERVVITILDGDEAGDKTRRALQNYFGNKKISFEANKNFVSLHNGFCLEGLFPQEWIIEAHQEHPNWFNDFSTDVEGKLQPFSMKNNTTKEQIRNYLIKKSDVESSFDWSNRFVTLFDALDRALKSQYFAVYGEEM